MKRSEERKPQKMTVEFVRAAVAEIEHIGGDDERAHSHEDTLHQAVLLAIAERTCDDPQACAKEALRTLDLDFSRWCA